MQPRRFVLAALVLAALAALGWFASRGTAPAPAAVEARVQTEARGSAPAAAELERVNEDPARTTVIAPEPASEAYGPVAQTRPVARALHGQAPQGGLLVRVLDPSSQPRIGAEVTFMAIGPDVRTIGGPLLTDSGGCVRIGGKPDTSFDIRASDSLGLYAPAYAFDKHLADRTVELRLEATSLHTLLVTDEQGAPVERFAWRLLDERQYRSHDTGRMPLDDNGLLHDTIIPGPKSWFAATDAEREQHPAGRVELRTGSLAFVVQVEAEDFVPAQAGPFVAEGAPAELHVVLQRAPGLRGRVLRDGQGVAGASVKLFRTPKDERAPLLNGFPSRIQAWGVSETTSESDGGFLLPLRTSGEFVIQAVAAQKGSAEFGPRRFSAITGADGIELVLSAPGAIEGRLLIAAEDLKRYRIIGGSCGDGQACSVHTDEEGRFRFENLRPGSWILMPTDEDLVPGRIRSMTIRTSALQIGPRAICAVYPGQTAHLDIDLRTKAVLVGELQLAGWEGASRRVTLNTLGTTFSRGATNEDDPPALLRLTVDQPGDYLLSLELEARDPEHSLTLEEQLHLEAGENAWKFERAVGELVLSNPLDTEVRAWLGCELGGTRRLQAGIKLGAHEERPLHGMPVGTWKMLRWEDGKQVEQGSVLVTAGASARLEWK